MPRQTPSGDPYDDANFGWNGGPHTTSPDTRPSDESPEDTRFGYRDEPRNHADGADSGPEWRAPSGRTREEVIDDFRGQDTDEKLRRLDEVFKRPEWQDHVRKDTAKKAAERQRQIDQLRPEVAELEQRVRASVTPEQWDMMHKVIAAADPEDMKELRRKRQDLTFMEADQLRDTDPDYDPADSDNAVYHRKMATQYRAWQAGQLPKPENHAVANRMRESALLADRYDDPTHDPEDMFDKRYVRKMTRLYMAWKAGKIPQPDPIRLENMREQHDRYQWSHRQDPEFYGELDQDPPEDDTNHEKHSSSRRNNRWRFGK